jgi:hypothetical protein
MSCSCGAPAFKPHVKFSAEDDAQLRHAVEVCGIFDWRQIAEHLPEKSLRQCKDRWTNYLCPTLNTSPWSPDEDALLVAKYLELGSKWRHISRHFANRTDSMVKNRFMQIQRRERTRIFQQIDTEVCVLPNPIPVLEVAQMEFPRVTEHVFGTERRFIAFPRNGDELAPFDRVFHIKCSTGESQD